MSLMEMEFERQSNPVDMIEFVAANNDWSFERSGEDEIAMTVEGKWADYHVSFSWMEEFEALHLACAFDFKVPEKRLPEMYRLVAQINEQLWLGHFELWSSSGIILFRHGALLGQGGTLTLDQAQVLIETAIDECERFYPVFQFVLWGGKSPSEAISASLIETRGEA